MRRASITSLLLLAILLGLSAGPHPCHAAKAKATTAAVVAEHASCHGAGTPTPAPKSNHDCCDPTKGGHVLCDQACQGLAVLGGAPMLAESLSFQDLAVPSTDCSGASFVLPIDHVPLA
jgi:uncharacterized protein involved in copper resistance